MIRRLIILLLIVGCEEAGITTNGLTDGTAVTDTLYISNDTTIYVYDTLIVNYDTTIYVIDTVYINSIDCEGVEGGTAQYDNCGVCDTDLSNDCVPDCAGVWGGNFVEDCNGVCNGDAVPLWGLCYSFLTTNLDLFLNNLTGEIPPEIGQLTNLTTLYLQANELTGAIPSEIGNLTNLGHLNLYRNQLTGSIPEGIGNLTNLTFLWLSENQLSGEIPVEIGNLTNLTELSLRNNQLTGEIPPEVCDLIENNTWHYPWNIENHILAGNNLINTCD